MSAAQGTQTVVVSKDIAAGAERVFDAWIDPAVAIKWLFKTPDGQMQKAEIDARVGGKFNLTDRRDGVDVEHIGEYLAVDRPKRLSFKWVVPKYTDHWTVATVDVTPTLDGCHVRLTHEGVLSDYVEQTRKGWTVLLDSLATQTA
jgi:uncharacterized protein YndB with AHSA1/START domain